MICARAHSIEACGALDSSSNLGRGILARKGFDSLFDLDKHLEGFRSSVLKKDYSENHKYKLLRYSTKIRFYTHFFTSKELGKVKEHMQKDAYYTAIRSLCNYFSAVHDEDRVVEEELHKIRKHFPKPSCQPDLYTPTDQDVQETLSFLKGDNEVFYRFYVGLMCSGVRIRELAEYVNHQEKYREEKKEDFKKVLINSTRGKKSCYYIYLPASYEAPERVSLTYLSRYLIKNKKVIRPKYLRNWFYSKCIELGIPAPIADFYQGRSAISMGNKHYLEKEKLADKEYVKIIGGEAIKLLV